MTPCEKLGYKVGDWFEVLAVGCGMQVGDIIQLYKDDGSTCPLFKGNTSGRYYLVGDNEEGAYKSLEDVRKVEKEEPISKFLKENKWWIKCESSLQFDLINKWLKEYYGDCSRFNPPENLKILTNFNSYGMKDYVMWNSRDDYPAENEITLEFETVIKSVKLPEPTPKEPVLTEQQIKIAELEDTIAKASAQINQLKEMK